MRKDDRVYSKNFVDYNLAQDNFDNAADVSTLAPARLPPSAAVRQSRVAHPVVMRVTWPRILVAPASLLQTEARQPPRGCLGEK